LDNGARLFKNDITGKGSIGYFYLEERFKRLAYAKKMDVKNREPGF
jgi:hypothetical protein